MKLRTRTTLTLGFALLLPLQPLSAQSLSFRGPAASAVGTATDPGGMKTRLDKAEQLRIEGRFAEARREYTSIARQQQKEGVFSGEALWKLAELQHGKHPQLAAETMDKIAREAARYGEPVMQAQALLEAAVFYKQIGQPEQARARLERLEPLLSSPFLAEDARDWLRKRSGI